MPHMAEELKKYLSKMKFRKGVNVTLASNKLMKFAGSSEKRRVEESEFI